MVAVPSPHFGTFPESPYAAELQADPAKREFTPTLEAEYLRSCLLDGRSLIRVTCAAGVVIAASRGAEQLISDSWNPNLLLHIGLVLVASILLAGIAWSSWFTRIYLPFAQVIVPVRNAIAAIPIAGAAAHGQLELLMILPLMIVGPFFFIGLRFRAALVSVCATVASFAISAAVFELDASVAMRSCTFLLMAAIACVLAARRLESVSRKSFLEGRLIAELAQLDALTGTKNRRVLDEHLSRLWQQAAEDGRTLAVLLIDVDHFKGYNDRYGHQAGDQALRRVAQTLQSFACRPLDLLARYGGEEFAAVLYDMDAAQAQGIADRMRRAVCDMGIEHRGSRVNATVTVSIGVAVVEPTNGRRPRGALQLADEALYKAKLKGRNTVVMMSGTDYQLMVTGVFAKGLVQSARPRDEDAG